MTVNIIVASRTGVKLETLDSSVSVALLQSGDSREWRSIGCASAHFIHTALSAPHAVVRSLNAGSAISQQFTELLVRGHSSGLGVVDALHVSPVVDVVSPQYVTGNISDMQTLASLLVPDALGA